METRSHRKFLLRKFFDEYMDLNRSKEDEQVTVDSIRNGVEFKGTNLWVLIFATFIASLGLNVNSTAVIIGAMLISPLMGCFSINISFAGVCFSIDCKCDFCIFYCFSVVVC